MGAPQQRGHVEGEIWSQLAWVCFCPVAYKLCDPRQVLHLPEPVSPSGDGEYAIPPCSLMGLKQTSAVPRLGAC